MTQTTQIVRTVSALRDRLATVYSDASELAHTATHATKNNFMDGMADVFGVMVHETDGSVLRHRISKWVDDYKKAGGNGDGPQLVIWPDGSVSSLVELPYRSTHGNFQNARTIGVESGHGNDGRFGDVETAPDIGAAGGVRNGWTRLTSAAADVTGSTSAKFFVRRRGGPGITNPEVLVASWATASYTTPAREQPGVMQGGMYATLIKKEGAAAVPPAPTLMVWPEAQYRSWALLGRYLAEALLIPRNFPVLPHARSDHMTADIFKRIVLADQQFDKIVAGLRGGYHGVNLAFVPADFTDPAQLAAMRAHYAAANVAQGAATGLGYTNSAMNLAWFRLFDFYRGFHGHGFSGNSLAGQDDHDCPGPMFDWHRFAREVWDWWWYPFDFDAGHTTTAVAQREYRRATTSTTLLDYFHDETTAPYVARTTTPGGIQGPRSSPTTFRLEQNAPVYALANGELVAARFPSLTGQGLLASMAFVLVRHEVWHRPDPLIAPRAAGALDAAHGGVPDAGRIDYSAAPSIVYSLQMHLGRPDGMSFTQVVDANPDWLNRVIARKIECDIARPPALNGALAPALAAIPATDFTAPSGQRRTPLEGWQMDQDRYGAFLTSLAAGDVAVAPVQAAADTYGPTPMRVLLGDLLGIAGNIGSPGGTAAFGTRVEVFSPQIVDAQAFTAVTDQTAWNPPAGITRPALRYQSEWSRDPNALESAALMARGVDPTLVHWWTSVAVTHTWDVSLPQGARLPENGQVFHYDPIPFMQWINDVTWASEWPKYRITGAVQPPRSRRV